MLVAPHTPVPAVIIKKCPQILLNLPWEKKLHPFCSGQRDPVGWNIVLWSKGSQVQLLGETWGWVISLVSNQGKCKKHPICASLSHQCFSLLSLSPSTTLSINPWPCPHIKFKQSHPWLKTTILDLKPMVLSPPFTREVAECMVSHLFQK